MPLAPRSTRYRKGYWMMLRKLYPELFNKRVWQNWWKPPPFDWWIGRDRDYAHWLKVPLVAHAINWLVFALPGLALGMTRFEAYAYGVLAVFAGQLQAFDKLNKGHIFGYDIRNVLYRTVIAVIVGALIVV
jgi:hypothetical protein